MTREELNQEKQKEIFSEQRNEKRKKITIFLFKLMFFIVACFIIFYLYTTFVSTKIIHVYETRIIHDKLPDNFNGLKIVHFSDLHYGTTIFSNELKNVVDEINSRSPDIVVFTGDLIDTDYKLSTSEQELVINSLNKIKASLGKYAISGEEDSEDFFTIMKQSNFEIINNTYDLVYKDDDVPIILIGLDSYVAGKTNMEEAFSYFSEPNHNSDLFSITLLHEPDIADELLSMYNSDLLLAGHSHNGTIRLPWLGGTYKYSGAKKYVDRFYEINGSSLYVSGGVGTNGPGFRLFCPPSINFFRISNK